MKAEIIDLVQTAFMAIVAAALIYVVWRLEKAFETAAGKLRMVIQHQREIQEGLERAWRRIDEIETQQGTRQSVMPLGKLQETINALTARVRALEDNSR